MWCDLTTSIQFHSHVVCVVGAAPYRPKPLRSKIKACSAKVILFGQVVVLCVTLKKCSEMHRCTCLDALFFPYQRAPTSLISSSNLQTCVILHPKKGLSAQCCFHLFAWFLWRYTLNSSTNWVISVRHFAFVKKISPEGLLAIQPRMHAPNVLVSCLRHGPSLVNQPPKSLEAATR